jgi:hypothetical protein
VKLNPNNITTMHIIIKPSTYQRQREDPGIKEKLQAPKGISIWLVSDF